MAQTAAHLVVHVIPHVAVRQWVLSLPIPLRLRSDSGLAEGAFKLLRAPLPGMRTAPASKAKA
jgi:hypothetical protein